MMQVSMAELLPFIQEAFAKNMTFKIPITGTSMNPLLVQGRDYVIIKKPDLPLETGDLPLYRRDDGAFVLHRVVGKNADGYIMCGDNQFLLEKNITDKHIVGVVCTICRDGKLMDVTDPEYVKHKNKYVKNLKTRYPVRRLKYTLYRLKNGK
ncbi:MAG: S24/S26 family peptidase [Clostridia bacterium]|nr:S24/S26 family peptidase [Clostridia bacterium]